MDRPANTFLRSLNDADWRALSEHLQPVELRLGDVLYGIGDAVDHVYWLERGLFSVVSSSLEGESVETAMIGRESGCGLVEACGGGRSFLTVLVQLDGNGVRTSSEKLRELAHASATFREALFVHADMVLAEARQNSVCQAQHQAEARCARWLMESADRSGLDDSLPLTQEYLAAMLGVQRTTVSAISGALQRRGLIRSGRGRIEIVDPEGLERAACACRRVLTEWRGRLGR